MSYYEVWSEFSSVRGSEHMYSNDLGPNTAGFGSVSERGTQ